MDHFLDNVLPKTDPRLPIIDVKYNSLHHLNAAWRNPGEAPWLILQARRHNLPVLHLQRRNLVEVFVSGILAERNQVWHARSADEVRVASIEVNIPALERFLHRVTLEAETIRNWLGAKTPVLDLYYESLFEENELAESAATQIARFLDIPEFEDRSLTFVKQNRIGLTESIENYDKVLEALWGTEYEWMLRAT